MAGSGPVGHSPVDADRLVLRGPGIYHGGVMVATSGGAATVDIYDGLDTGGDLIDSLRCAASGRDASFSERGIAFARGLYVDLGSNVDRCTVFVNPPEAPGS